MVLGVQGILKRSHASQRGENGRSSPQAAASKPTSAARSSREHEVGRHADGEGHIASAEPLTMLFDWRNCGTFGSKCIDASDNGTKMCSLTSKDEGKRLRVRVTLRNAAGTTWSAPFRLRLGQRDLESDRRHSICAPGKHDGTFHFRQSRRREPTDCKSRSMGWRHADHVLVPVAVLQ